MLEKSVLICGHSGTGKSSCLKGLENPEGVMYLNCEGKPLPFKSSFKKFNITEPEQVFEALTKVNTMDNIHTVVIDSFTFLMDMYEAKYVANATNGQRAWGDYATFIKRFALDYLNKCKKNVIVLAHTGSVYNENQMVTEIKVCVKGSVGKTNGLESYFTNVIYTKVVDTSKLQPNDYLKITEKEELLGCKHVFQTFLTKETRNESIKTPEGLFELNELYIDNNAQYILNKLEKFYAD